MTRQKYIIAACLLFVIVFSNCAYFNVFFNARKAYNKAIGTIEQSNSQNVPAGAITEFNVAITKASKILSVYPGSRWTDDALLLIGKSYFYMERYKESSEALLDLIDNLPNSNLIPEARSFYAKNLLHESKFELAQAELIKITESDADNDIKSGAFFDLADQYYFKEEYTEAVKQYNRVLNEIDDKKILIQAQLKLAESYRLLGEFEQAADAFKRVSDYNPSTNIRYLSEIGYGMSLQDIGQYDESIEIFRLMLMNTNYIESFPEIFIEIARSYELKGDIEESIKVLEEFNKIDFSKLSKDTDFTKLLDTSVDTTSVQIIDNNKAEKDKFDLERNQQLNTNLQQNAQQSQQKPVEPKNTFKGNPEALYYIGELNMQKYHDFATAKKYYVDAVQIATSPEQKAEINAKIAVIKEIEKQKGLLISRIPEKPIPPKIEVQLPDSISAHEVIDTSIVDVVKLGGEADSLTVDKDNVSSKRKQDSEEEKELASRRKKDLLAKELDRDQQIEEKKEVVKIPVETIIAINDSAYIANIIKYNIEMSNYTLSKSKALYRLAEIYDEFLFSEDSTVSYLSQIVDEVQDSTYAPKALLYLYDVFSRHDIEEANKFKDRLFEDYPNSMYKTYFLSQEDRETARLRELPRVQTTIADSVQKYYDIIENRYAEDKDYISAIESLLELESKFPGSEGAAKALYAIGWILHNDLRENKLAISAFERLKKDYPNSAYAISIKSKLDQVNQLRTNRERAKKLFEATEMARIAAIQADSIAIANGVKIEAQDSVGIVDENSNLVSDTLNYVLVEPDSLIADSLSVANSIKPTLMEILLNLEEDSVWITNDTLNLPEEIVWQITGIFPDTAIVDSMFIGDSTLVDSLYVGDSTFVDSLFIPDSSTGLTLSDSLGTALFSLDSLNISPKSVADSTKSALPDSSGGNK